MYFNARVRTLQLFTKSISKLTQSATFSLIVLFALGSFSSFGQTSIFSNPITGTNPNSANPYTFGQVVSSGITVSGIGRGAGITSNNANDRYNASGWNSTSQALAISNSDYFEWTITPGDCNEIDFTSFVYTSERSNSSIANFSFRSSVDNYAANIGSPISTGATISLSANAFQNITAPITFRFYAWGADQASRTFSINDFTFNGSVVPYGPNNPAANAVQTFCAGATVADLTATGTALQWYSSSYGGSVLPASTVLTSGFYYVDQTVLGCQSSPLSEVTAGLTTFGTSNSNNTNRGLVFDLTSDIVLKSFKVNSSGAGSITVTLTNTGNNTSFSKSITVNLVAGTNTVNVESWGVIPIGTSYKLLLSSNSSGLNLSRNDPFSFPLPFAYGSITGNNEAGNNSNRYNFFYDWKIQKSRTQVQVSISSTTVSAASSIPAVCINTAITNITHATTGATGIGSASGLPAGITASWSANTITISGTPTVSGTFNYSIPLTGCGSTSATGTITVSGTPEQFPALANGDYVWTGAIDGNWTTDANWSIYNSLTNSFTVAANDPNTSGLNVFIPPVNSCNNYGITILRNNLLNNDRSVNNITILASGQLTVDQDNDSLSVYGNWVNNGVFNHNNRNAKVDFKHASNSQTIGGTSQTQFYNLEISNNNSNNVVLNQSVSVAANFKFDGNRKLELGNNSLSFLGNSSITGANNSRYFITNGNGTVNRTVSNGNVIFPVGISLYNPCALSNSGTSDIFSVRILDNVTQDGSGIGVTTPAKCVKRTWMISEGVIGGSDVTMKLQWNGNSAEHINGFTYNPGFMYIAHHNGTNWEDKGSNGQSNAANAHFLTQSNITSFSPFSIADASTPLPVELTSFNAVCEEGKGVNVTWSTASEHNSSYFDVLKSEDGHNWRSISIVSAAGNSTSNTNYGVVDAEKANGIAYYKLMQYDIDGQSKEYGPISSDCYHLGEMVVKTFPNPSGDEFYVELISPEATSTVITIIDAQGKSVYTRTVETEKGSNLYTIESLNILPGMYYIQISNDLTTPNVVKHSFR